MLVQFKVRNIFSYKKETTFSLLATQKREHMDHIKKVGKKLKKGILKTSVIYGPNGGGKSNLLKALSLMDTIVSSRKEKISDHSSKWEPFLLNSNTEKEASLLEVVIQATPDSTSFFRYGFEFNKDTVVTEWLFEVTIDSGVEKKIFTREASQIDVSRNKEFDSIRTSKKFINENNNDVLFLSVLDFIGIQLASQITNWFSKLNFLGGMNLGYANVFKANGWFSKEENKERALQIFEMLDISVSNFQLGVEPNDDEIPNELDSEKRKIYKGMKTPVKIMHDVYSDEGLVVGQKEFLLHKQESAGTEKIFDLLGPLIQTIQVGGTLLIDELDIKLHPIVVRQIVEMFNDTTINTLGAQLICTTHNPYLLNKKILRRDEIWFAQKNTKGESEIYSLIEFEEVRNDSSYEKDYFLGRYGAIPCKTYL